MAARVVTPSGKRRTLFIPVGLPGAGKTTFARKLDKNAFQIVSQDQKGISFSALLKYLSVLFKATDRHLYVDSCNHTISRREKLAQLGLDAGLQVVFLLFDYPVAVCKANLLKRVHRKEAHPSVNDEAVAEIAFSDIADSWQSVCEYERRTIDVTPGVSLVTVYSFLRADQLAAAFNARA